MSRFIVHIDGELTHQQQCALAVAVNQRIGVMAAMEHQPVVGYRWEYQQDNSITAPLTGAAHDLQGASS